MATEQERERMGLLATALKCRVRVDACGDVVLEGRRRPCVENNVHVDGLGYSVFTSKQSGKGLRLALEFFVGELWGEVRQRGRTEAVIWLGKIPQTEAQSKRFRELLGIKKIKEFSEETKERLRAVLVRAREKSPLSRKAVCNAETTISGPSLSE